MDTLKKSCQRGCLLILIVTALPLEGYSQKISLEPDDLEIGKANVTLVTYHGKKATRVWSKIVGDDEVVLAKNVKFLNGTIEVELAGGVLPGADPEARGFVGIAFRVKPTDPQQFESF